MTRRRTAAIVVSTLALAACAAPAVGGVAVTTTQTPTAAAASPTPTSAPASTPTATPSPQDLLPQSTPTPTLVELADPPLTGDSLPPAAKTPGLQVFTGPLAKPAVTVMPKLSRKTVYLTFDDGPGPYTGQVLHTLHKYGVNATFFVIGTRVPTRVALVRAAVAYGNSVENHTWSHRDLTTLNTAQVNGQIKRANTAIKNADGKAPTCLRPPYGAQTAAIRQRAEAFGLRTILWSLDTTDWKTPGTSTIVNRVVKHAQDGSIILMHDGGGDRKQTVAALPGIIRGLQARGFSFGLVCH